MPEVMSIEVDEEFDPRPPKQPLSFRDDEGKLNWKLIVGVVIAVLLILALIIVVTQPFKKEEKAVVSTWTPKDPTKKSKYLVTYPATSQIAISVQSSLEAWAKYYTTAKLDDLSQSFDLAGPQYAQLVQDQAKVAAEPEAGMPSIIELGPLGDVSREEDIYTTRAIVTWTKPGSDDPKVYHWDIDMKSVGSKFVLYTVRDTDPKEKKKPIDFCGAADLISQVEDDDKLAKETASMPADQQLEVTLQMMSIRLKVWEQLQAAVAGTDSQYDVDPIVESYKDLVQAGRTAKTTDDLANVAQNDITDSTNAIVERASKDCGVDITKR